MNEIRGRNGLERNPVILLFDGHDSHIGVRILELTNNENIRLIEFPSQPSQPIKRVEMSLNVSWVWEKNYGQGRVSTSTRECPFEVMGWKQARVSTTNGVWCTGLHLFNMGLHNDDWFLKTEEAMKILKEQEEKKSRKRQSTKTH